MRGKKDTGSFYEGEKEESKYPPQQIPWLNPNELHRKKDASVSYGEEKEKVKGENPPDGHVCWSNLNEVLASIEDGSTTQGLVAEEGVGMAYPGKSGGQPVVSPSTGPNVGPSERALHRRARRHHIFTEQIRPGAVRMAGPGTGSEGYEDDERTIEIGYEGQATVATHEESTIHVIAQTVDTEEENRRLRQQERVLFERDQLLRERDQLRHIVDNAVVGDPVAVTESDVENRIGAAHDGDSSEHSGRKCGTRGRRWFAIGAILLIVVAVVVAVAIVRSSSTPMVPGTPTPTPTTSGGIQGNICGSSFLDAAKCQVSCPQGLDAECPLGEACFANITCQAPVAPSAPTPTPTTSGGIPGNNCGSSFLDAAKCQVSCPQGLDGECPSGETCFASITCQSPVAPSAPTSTPPTSGGTPGNNCGSSFLDAAKCQVSCPQGLDAECPSGETCFASITCTN